MTAVIAPRPASRPGFRSAARPPAVDALPTIDANRHRPSRPIRTATVSAVPGDSSPRTIDSGPWAIQPTATAAATRTGSAKTRPVRRAPAYHWPRPGHRNDRNAASPGECPRPPRVSVLTAGRSLPPGAVQAVADRSSVEPGLHHHQAAVDGQHLPRDERGLVADEERDGVGDLLGRAEPAEGRPGRDLGLERLGQVLGELGEDEAGRHCVA